MFHLDGYAALNGILRPSLLRRFEVNFFGGFFPTFKYNFRWLQLFLRLGCRAFPSFPFSLSAPILGTLAIIRVNC